MKVYKPINPINVSGGEPLNELKIEVGYTKGGYNSKRGVYAWITPIRRNNGLVSQILLGELKETGFKVCLREMQRKNAKVEQSMIYAVIPLADKIVEHYEKCEFHEISRMILQAVENV